jgi:hypothetical protein
MRSHWQSHCKTCVGDYKKTYYKRNKVEIERRRKIFYEANRSTINKRQAERRLSKSKDKKSLKKYRQVLELSDFHFYIHQRMGSWRTSARKRSFVFRLTLKDILSLLEKQRNRCEYSGQRLIYKPGHVMTVSLDRVDSSKGYTKDNVIACGHYINLMKIDLSFKEFKKMVAKVHMHLNRR